MSNKAQKRGLIPKLRFPEFRDSGEWQSAQLEDLISTVTPPKKIQTSDYLSEGSFPIIDQGQSDIAGWTNDPDSIVEASQPIIVFGDHTCALKLIRRSFAQGADGIKIIKGSGLADTAFLYQFLCFRPVVTEEYKRHFSILKTKVVTYPDLKSGEQQKIADCLASLDELLTLEAQKLDTLKTHKKGLMQQLFPAEGETLPKLRFPEFRDAGEWEENTLGNLVEIRSGNSPSQYKLDEGGKYPFVKVEDLNNCEKHQAEAREYSNDTDGLVPRNSVIFPKRGAAIALNKVRLSNRDLLMDTNMMALTPNDAYRADFLFHYLSQIGLDRIADNSTIPQINNKHIIPFRVLVPLREEQQKIADCLASLDDLITAQTQKLTALKTHKKGLMQQLFPSVGGVAGEA